jgi:pyruvate/2-oxoglutarate dehydrogenase complex dihydrolipoamide acyltransferase (E2) component
MINTVSAPRINTNDDEFEVVAWHVADGAWVNAGDELADVETSKAVVTINAESAGYVRPLVAVSCVVRVGEPLYLCASTAEALAQPVQRPADVTPVSAAVPDVAEPSAPRLSRAAQRMAAERGIATDSFRGLVTARALAGNAPAAANAVETNAARATALPPAAIAPAGPAVPRRERVSRGKLAEAQALATGERGNINSLLTVYFDSAAVRARLLREQSFDGNIQPLILFEISRLLKQWPQFTAYFDDGEIRYYDRIDLGVAMDLGQGLKVVTLRDASRLMPIEIFEQTIAAGLRYLDNKLTPEELTGSTLTVTDLSGFNVLHFHPLINGHQSAIIGLVVMPGSLAIRCRST